MSTVYCNSPVKGEIFSFLGCVNMAEEALLSEYLVISVQSLSSSLFSHGCHNRNMNTWFLIHMDLNKQKTKAASDQHNKLVSSYNDDVEVKRRERGGGGGGVWRKKKGALCQEKGEKLLNKWNYIHYPQSPNSLPQPNILRSLVMSFLFQLILLPHFLIPHPRLPFFLSVSVSPSVSRQAETGRLLLCLQSDTISS